MLPHTAFFNEIHARHEGAGSLHALVRPFFCVETTLSLSAPYRTMTLYDEFFVRMVGTDARLLRVCTRTKRAPNGLRPVFHVGHFPPGRFFYCAAPNDFVRRVHVVLALT